MARDEETREGIEASAEGEDTNVFELGQERKTEKPFEYDEDELNLVAAFKEHTEGRAALKRIGQKCIDDFEGSWNATEAYRKSMADMWKLFSGILDSKPPPFDELTNPHVPLLLENIQRMGTRQAYELFGNWTNVFGVTPIGPDDEQTAKLLSLHGNWQIRKRIKDFKRQIGHRGLLVFNLFGDVTCHSYWDAQRRSNRHEILTANEFVCANAHVSTMPDYSDVSWLAKVIYMDAHELRKMDDVWEDVGSTLKVMPPEWDTDQELREAVDKTIGVDSSAYQKGQYKLIQYEGWLNLPPTTALDANGEPSEPRDRYCQVVVDTQTRTALKLSIHERMDPYDKRRFEFEMKQLEAWKQATAERQAFIQEIEQTKMSALTLAHEIDPNSDGPAQAIAMSRAVEETPVPPEPPMPDWMRGDPEALPRPPDTVPIRLFAHGVNIEPLQGVLGLGPGSIYAPQNKSANIALGAFFDQALLGNFKNFLAKGDVRFPKPFKIKPGGVHEIQGATDLSKDVLPLDFGEANPQLLQLVQTLTEYANRVSNTPEVLSGEAGKSGETAQGLSARIEQATKMLSVPTGKYADFLSQVLENNAALNAIFLEDVEFFSVNNHDPMLGELGRQNFSVGREMYDRPYDVEISADLKFTSTQQRISEADALVQLPNAVMALQGNFALQYETIKKSFEARNRYDLIALLGPPPQPPVVFGAPTSPPAPPPGAVPTPPAPGGQAPPGGPPQPQQGAA